MFFDQVKEDIQYACIFCAGPNHPAVEGIPDLDDSGIDADNPDNPGAMDLEIAAPFHVLYLFLQKLSTTATPYHQPGLVLQHMHHQLHWQLLILCWRNLHSMLMFWTAILLSFLSFVGPRGATRASRRRRGKRKVLRLPPIPRVPLAKRNDPVVKTFHEALVLCKRRACRP